MAQDYAAVCLAIFHNYTVVLTQSAQKKNTKPYAQSGKPDLTHSAEREESQRSTHC